MLVGPLNEQDLPPASFDAVVLNDVLEHLADPADTIRRCAALLKDDGVLFVQTPCFPEGASYAELRGREDRFLAMMDARLAKQHLYLFSQRAARRLMEREGLAGVEFVPAIFPYDMYFVAARQAPRRLDPEALTASPAGRMTLAWLDLLKECETREADRAARLEVIHRLDAGLRQCEAARAALEAENRRLKSPLWRRAARRLLRPLNRLVRAE
jgi:SAM-dependent methyltransferase